MTTQRSIGRSVQGPGVTSVLGQNTPRGGLTLPDVRHKPRLSVIAGRVWTSSLVVAEHFGKRHDNVMRDIRALANDAPSEWHVLNFEEMYRSVAIGQGATRRDPFYRISRDGFAILAMGFTGKRALEWKIAYVRAFNQMEQTLQASPAAAAVKHPALRLDAEFYTRLLYALEHKASWAMVTWCLLRMDAQVSPVKASYRELMHAMGDAVSVSSVWQAVQSLIAKGLVRRQPEGYRLDEAALGAMLTTVADMPNQRPGLVQAPPAMSMVELAENNEGRAL